MLSISESNGIVVHQLRKALATYGLKQAEVARKAGFTAQEMNDMLAGRRLIRVADIDSILKVIGKPQIDANYLFGMNKEIQVLSDDDELIASITKVGRESQETFCNYRTMMSNFVEMLYRQLLVVSLCVV